MPLRIVVWNCAQALDRKFDQLLSLRPDVAIVPECAEPDILRRKAPQFLFADCEWTGEYKDKGLGVFSFGKLNLRRHPSWDRSYQTFIPVEVRGSIDFNLLAVWAFNHRATVSPNPSTTLDAVQHYTPFLEGGPSVVAGDFNASVIWDKPNDKGSFGNLTKCLKGLRLESCYHGTNGEQWGKEAKSTLWWQRNKDKGYHIDYIFAPEEWQGGCSMTVGDASEWLAYSDHAPLVAEFNMPAL